MTLTPTNLSSELPPRTVAAADTDGSLVPQYVIAGGQSFRAGVTSDTPGSTTALSIYWLNQLLQPYAVVRVQFTARAAPDWGKVCVATAPYDPCWPVSGAKAIAIKVDSVSAGNSTISGSVS